MQSLPLDVIVHHLFPFLYPRDVFNLCNILPQLEMIMMNQEFWRGLVASHYADYIDHNTDYINCTDYIDHNTGYINCKSVDLERNWKQYFIDILDERLTLKPVTL